MPTISFKETITANDIEIQRMLFSNRLLIDGKEHLYEEAFFLSSDLRDQQSRVALAAYANELTVDEAVTRLLAGQALSW